MEKRANGANHIIKATYYATIQSCSSAVGVLLECATKLDRR